MGLIYRTAQSLLTVEGVLLGLLSLLEFRGQLSRILRSWTVVVTVLSIIVSLIVTIWTDAYQSLPVNQNTASPFLADIIRFGLVLEFYFVGLLNPPRRRR